MLFHPEKLSSLVVRARHQKGFSQMLMAQKLGISQKTYSYIESGRSKPDIIKFLKIADATETHPMQMINKLFTGIPSWENIETKEQIQNSEIEKLKAEIAYLKSVISYNQITILKKLEHVLETQESNIPFNSYK